MRKELKVKCTWCGANPGEPCCRPSFPADKYPTVVHRVRIQLYDEEERNG